MRNKRSFLGLLALASSSAFLALSACGGDDGDDGSSGAGGSTSSGGATSGSGGTSSSSGGTTSGGVPTDVGMAQCEALGSLCHEVDDGAGPTAECHDLGHVGDPEACAERFVECVEVCVTAEGGEGAGGAGGAGESGSSELCSLIGSICHEVDDGDGPLHECHELGHSADPAECAAQAESCLMMCILAAAEGAGGGGGAGGSP